MEHEERVAPTGPCYLPNTITDSNMRSSSVIYIYMYISI